MQPKSDLPDFIIQGLSGRRETESEDAGVSCVCDRNSSLPENPRFLCFIFLLPNEYNSFLKLMTDSPDGNLCRSIMTLVFSLIYRLLSQSSQQRWYLNPNTSVRHMKESLL